MIKFLLVLAAIGVSAVSCNKVQKPFMESTVEVAGQVINVEVADTDPERVQGLSNLVSLSEDQGMLFVFPNPGVYGFWMKDMNFAIDIIWIKNDIVVDITENVKPQAAVDKDLETYYPKQEVDKVLELTAGWSAKNGLKVGDSVKINLP